jgi:hypothetical protein|tara:strand:+ start:15277 stop:15513 length:237 start_codon:yes stop_codon:yes gene_type:complete
MFNWFKKLLGFGTVTNVVNEVLPEPKQPIKKVAVKKADLAKLTKDKLEAFAKENYEVDIDKRRKKDDLVKEVFALSKK